MLKGKTIIELTDTKTGEVEKFEDNNTVTQAINEIILKRRNYTGFSDGQGAVVSDNDCSSFMSMFPLYKGFFGGIMLFENTIDENRMFLNGDDKIIGSATYDNGYSGTDNLIGSYNTNESEVNETEKYVKFVYDFATNQGNGTISAVCLGNYHYNYHRLFGTTCDEYLDNVYINNLVYSSYRNYSVNSSHRLPYEPNYVLFPTGVYFEYGEIKDFEVRNNSELSCYEHPVLFDDSKGHLITLEYVSSKGKISYSDVADTIRLHVYEIGVNHLTLFESFDNTYYNRIIPREVFAKDFEVTEFGSYGVYNLVVNYGRQAWYDKSSGYAYLLGDLTSTYDYWKNETVMTLFKLNLNVDSYESITLETIEITNKTGKQIYISTCKSGQHSNREFAIKDGYMYVPLGDYSTGEGMAKINVQDSTDVTVIDSGGNRFPRDIQGDLIYTNGYVKIINTKTNEIKKCRVSNASKGVSSIPFKNNDIYVFKTGLGSSDSPCWYGTICSRNDYLATINNLDTPVTKTSDKTMKITYILREE